MVVFCLASFSESIRLENFQLRAFELKIFNTQRKILIVSDSHPVIDISLVITTDTLTQSIHSVTHVL